MTNGIFSRFNSGRYTREACGNCGKDYLRDRTHTGEVHCPHCGHRVAVQIGENIDDD